MSLPQAIFIDTCILDREHYCFESTQLSALAGAVKGKGLKLLLPAPTKQEIEKHIREDTTRAVAALMKVRKDNPVLRRLESIPSPADAELVQREIHDKIVADRKAFEAFFTLIELDYSTVELAEVMQWYGAERAPFGPGLKRKEFPDAFALAILKAYARGSGERLAIVSADNDFKAACKSVPNLFHFPSLPALTNSILSVERYHDLALRLMSDSTESIREKLSEVFPDRAFYHDDDPSDYGDIDDVKVKEMALEEASIVCLGHQEFAASFTAMVSFSAWAEYDDPNSWISDGEGDGMFLHQCKGEVEDDASVSVTARFSTNEDWSAVTAVEALRIEEDYITVYAPAPQCDEPDDYGDGEPPPDDCPASSPTS